MRWLPKIKWIAFLAGATVLCALSLMAQINPATQINWPLITGSGAPVVACTALNAGQPYVNIASSPNVEYRCGTTSGSPAWVIFSAGVAGPYLSLSGGTVTGPITANSYSTPGGTIVPAGAALPYAGWAVYAGSGTPALTCSATQNQGAIATNGSLDSYLCSNATGTWQWNPVAASGGSGTVSGQTANYVPLASAPTAITGPSNLYESGGVDIFNQPTLVNGNMQSNGYMNLTQLTNPQLGTTTTATTGGTLPASTSECYTVTATNSSGESFYNTDACVTTGSGTATNTATVNWLRDAGATGYKVYGRTSGSELLMATIASGDTLSWVDNGSVTPSGAKPAANTTQGCYQINGACVVPAIATGYHGTVTGTKVQMSDGTGPSGALPSYDANGTLTDSGKSIASFAPALSACIDESTAFTPADGHCYFVTAAVSTATPAASAFVAINFTNSSAGSLALTGTTILDGGNCASYISGTTLTLPASEALSLKSDGTNIRSTCTVAAGAGTVTDGAGVTTANKLPVSTATAHVLAYIDFPDFMDIPAANCNNATAGAGWSLPTSAAPTVACRTGTNVQAGVLQFAASNSAQFTIALPGDYDSAGTVYARIRFTQGTNATSGQTIIMQMATGCSSTTDDPTFNTAQSFATATTTATANTPFDETLSTVTMTGCTAGHTMNVKISRTTDTATVAPNVYFVTLTIPRLLVNQAN